MPKKRTKKKRNTKALRNWAKKGRKMSGGFLSLIIGALVAAGISASTAASAAAVIAPIAAGVAGSVGAYAGTKLIKAVGGGKKRLTTKSHRTRGHRLY
jgi:hypothetical protein